MTQYYGYTNFETHQLSLYFDNGHCNDGTYHVNELLKIKCFKNLESFKQFVLSRLKTDSAWKTESDKNNIINNCDWKNIFDTYKDDCFFVNNANELLKHFTADDNKILLPNFQLDRELYLECKEIIESYGYRYIAGSKKRFEKPNVVAKYDLERMINGVELKSAQELFDYYPTPEYIVNIAQELLQHDNKSIILEPSCGTGNLIKGLESFVDAIEINSDCVKILKEKNINVIHDDFLTFNPSMKYDYIIMNPPFSKKQDVLHIIKAFSLLNEGGVLVAIASSNVLSKSKELQDICDKHLEYSDMFTNKEFKSSGTNINTMILKLKK